jgi:DNA (cytosine-5)-methyltransferase 1
MSIAGLFAGIGGIERGLQASGHRSALLCEWDESAGRVLSDRFPGVPLAGDTPSLPRSLRSTS